jgi:hypothetical protein
LSLFKPVAPFLDDEWQLFDGPVSHGSLPLGSPASHI